MADITLETLNNEVLVLAQSVSDLRTLLELNIPQITTNTSDINDLQNPPPGVPSGLVDWFSGGHTITENDTVLDTRISTAEGSLTTVSNSVATLTTDLADEYSNRVLADIDLQAVDTGLQAQIDANLVTLTQEISDRSNLSSASATQYDLVNDRIDDLQSDLSSQTSSANTNINSLSSQISDISSNLQVVNDQITLLQGIGVDPLGAQASQISTLTTLANDASTAVALETTNRVNADIALQASVNTNSAALSNFQSQLDTEASTRSSADNTINTQLGVLSASVSGVSGSLISETSARIAADATLTTNVSTNTTNIANNTSAIATEITNRAAADTALQSQITTNTGNITTNTSAIATHTTDITGLKSHFGIVKDVGGYVTGWRINDDSAAAGSFNIKILNNDFRAQNPGYLGKYFPLVSASVITPGGVFVSQYGTAPSSFFHGTDGNDYTVDVNVAFEPTATINGGVFLGVDYDLGGSFNRLGSTTPTFVIDWGGYVNDFLSIWYRIKDTPSDLTQRWYAIADTAVNIPSPRDYEFVSGSTIFQVTVPSDKVIEFGFAVLSAYNTSIGTATTNNNIYSPYCKVMVLNATTVI